MPHKLEIEFRMTAYEILDVVLKNNRTLMNLKGAIAQEHLSRYLKDLMLKGIIENYESIDKDGQPDFKIKFRNKEFFLECKNVEKEKKGSKDITIDFWRTRYQKTKGPISRFYHQNDFQVLAACLYNRTGKWEFLFIKTRALPRHPEDPEKFTNRTSLSPNTTYASEWKNTLIKVPAHRESEWVKSSWD
jgi:hypothetical protein